MATKRYTPLDDPPSASSDDDETEDEQETTIRQTIPASSSSEDSEEEEEESEEETPEPAKPTHENPQIQNPNSKPAELSTEEESESDSEGETPTPEKKLIENPKIVTPNASSIFEFDSDVRSPSVSDFAIKPSKKINSFESPGKILIQKPKRASPGSESKDKKKIKVSNGDVDEEKKAVSKRVWSEEDELLLLHGFMDYHAKIGCSPLSDMDGFYQFVMNVVPGYASKSQLYEKVRRLKKKFRVNSEKVSGDGANPAFVKPHEHKLFDLSSKIWGKDGCESLTANAAGGGSNAKANAKANPKVNAKAKNKVLIKAKVEVKEKDEDDEKMAKMEDFETLYPYWNAGLSSEVSSALNFPAGVINLVKENLSLIGEAKAKEMNEKWEALFENEARLRKTRIALLSDVGK